MELQPTFSAVIEPHPEPRVDVDVDKQPPTAQEPALPAAPTPPPVVKQEPECCIMSVAPQLDALAVCQTMGAAFVLGAAVGAMLVYSFSKVEYIE